MISFQLSSLFTSCVNEERKTIDTETEQTLKVRRNIQRHLLYRKTVVTTVPGKK